MENKEQTRLPPFMASVQKSPSLTPDFPSVFDLYPPKAGIWWGDIFIPEWFPPSSFLPPQSHLSLSPLTVMDGAPSWNPKIAPRAKFCTWKSGTEVKQLNQLWPDNGEENGALAHSLLWTVVYENITIEVLTKCVQWITCQRAPTPIWLEWGAKYFEGRF